VRVTPTFVTVANDDIELEVAVAGDGPLILCIHGWPELWYSWRHQLDHFSERGYRVAAMNVRGYGASSSPPEIDRYSLRQLCGDAAAVIDELGDGPAIVWGHDWGAPIAWNTARFHADKVRAVVGLSVPYFPVGPVSPLALYKNLHTDKGKFFYQVYFQQEAVPEAELGADSLESIRKIYYSASGDVVGVGLIGDKGVDATMLEGLVDPDPFPAWASDADLAVYADAMDASGWRGPLNRYRAQGIDAAELGSLPDPNIVQPAAFIGGALDPVRRFLSGVDLYELAHRSCDDFRGTTLIADVGHWVQQEAPQATNEALENFLNDLV
jgi:pimeloyl-ACP methyl ester carboxylesterase